MLAASISALREAEEGQELEGRVGELLGRDAERVAQEILAERPAVEDELDVEGGLQRRSRPRRSSRR